MSVIAHALPSQATSQEKPEKREDQKAFEAAKNFEKAFWSMVLKDMYEESLRNQEEFLTPEQTNVFMGPMVDAFAEAIVEQESAGMEVASNSIAHTVYEEIKASETLKKQVIAFERIQI